MIKSTESEVIVNDLYGTGNSISPQMGVTYDPTFIFSEPSIPSIVHQVEMARSFLQGIETDHSTETELTERKQYVITQGQAKIRANIVSQDLKKQSHEPLKREQNVRLTNSSNLTHNLLSTIQKLNHQVMLKDNQIKHLKDKLLTYEAKFLSQAKSQSDKKILNEQQVEQSKQERIKISKKLKYYQTKSSSLQNANNQLFQKFNSLRAKLESQFQELHRFQIQNLQSQMLFEKQKSQAQKAQLLQRVGQYEQKIRKLQKQLKDKPTRHQCNVCRQYELSQSNSSLKRHIQQLKSQNSELKTTLDRTIKQRKELQEEMMKLSQMKSTMAAEVSIKSSIYQ